MTINIDYPLNGNNLTVNGSWSGTTATIYPNLTPQRLGWTCPGCRSCYSPDVQKCFTCGQVYTYTTCGNGYATGNNR